MYRDSNDNTTSNGRIFIDRPSLDNIAFDDMYGLVPEDEILLKDQACNACHKTCACDKKWWTGKLVELFPFVNAIRTYKFRRYIFDDILAGINVGIVHIPQSMGFSLLASLPPVYGLYSSFWQPLVYFFLAMSYHNSFATMAVPSLIVSAAVDREIVNWIPGNASDNSTNIMSIDERKAAMGSTIALLAGIVQLIMGICHMGTVTTLMPISFTSGFTTACGFFIASSQFKHLFGVSAVKYNGLWRLTKGWYDISSKLPKTNIATLVISICSFAFLIVIKEIINVKYKSKMKFPIPAELLLVIIATTCSYLVDFHDRWDVIIIGVIPKGIPTPAFPPMDIASNLIVDSVVCAILSFVISISMANLFVRKYKYHVDSNQELIAYGSTHIISSFFHCFAGSVAPPRNYVFEATGGKTRFAHLVSCALLLLVILVIAPLFQYLPNAVLGSIIIVALFPLFRNFAELPIYWKVSKVDFILWLVTWLVTSITDVGIGLGISMFCVLFITVIQSTFVKGHLLGVVGSDDLLAPVHKYSKAKSPRGIRVFQFESSLYFTTVQTFKSQLFSHTFNPVEALNKAKAKASDNGQTKEAEASESAQNGSINIFYNRRSQEKEMQENDEIEVIILDCSSFTFVDIKGINTLRDLYIDYKNVGVTLILAACLPSVRQKMQLAELVEGESDFSLFPTVQDAIATVSTTKHLSLDTKL